jgi:hypothetical protein
MLGAHEAAGTRVCNATGARVRRSRRQGGMSSESRGVLGRQRASRVLNAPARHPAVGASRPPAQAVPERMDGSHHLPNARVERWTTHQVAGTRCSAAA